MDLSSRQALPPASVQMQDIAERIGGVAGNAEGKLSLFSAYAEQSFMSVDEAAATSSLSGSLKEAATGTREIYTGLDGFAGAITAMIEIEADVRSRAAPDREPS